MIVFIFARMSDDVGMLALGPGLETVVGPNLDRVRDESDTVGSASDRGRYVTM